MLGTTSKAKLPLGRPSTYIVEKGQQVADAMATGLSLEAEAASCRIGPRTAFTWQAKHDEFRQAVEEGRARSLLFWERMAIALANGEAGNAAVVTLGLKNRSRAASGWHDAQRLEHIGSDGGAIMQEVSNVLDLTGLTDEELEVLERILSNSLERDRAALVGGNPFKPGEIMAGRQHAHGVPERRCLRARHGLRKGDARRHEKRGQRRQNHERQKEPCGGLVPA